MPDPNATSTNTTPAKDTDPISDVKQTGNSASDTRTVDADSSPRGTSKDTMGSDKMSDDDTNTTGGLL